MENVSVTSPRGAREPSRKNIEKQQNGKVIYLDAERAGESKIVRHPQAAKALIERENSNINTLYDSFQVCLFNFSFFFSHTPRMLLAPTEKRCLGFRKGEEDYQWLTYNEVAKRAHRFGSGLLHLGLKPVCYFMKSSFLLLTLVAHW